MELEEHLADCTVRVRTGSGTGTGFFVAPGLVVVPAHVVESTGGAGYPLLGAVEIHYRDQVYSGKTIRYAASPNPDIAILRAEVAGHPSAYLHAPVRSQDSLFVCGYSGDGPETERRLLEAAATGGAHFELQGPNLSSGMAGAPVLNLRTGGVCGIVRTNRHGRAAATSASVIATLFPGIMDTHDQHHAEESAWFDACGVRGTVSAARAHLLAMRQVCQEPIQPLLSPPTGAGAVDLMAPVRFRVLTGNGVERQLVDLPELARRCGSEGSGIMIVGPSGSGRSSMLRYLGYSAALGSVNLGKRASRCLFPIMIRANQLASREGGVEEQILNAIRTTDGRLGETFLPSTFLGDLIEVPGLRLLIMIDGVDEIQNSRDLAEVIDFIGRIRNETDFGKKARLVVTSRPSTAEHFRYSAFDVYEIQALDRGSVEIAARRWLGDGAEGFLRENGPLVDSGLFSSPLTLSVGLMLFSRVGRRLSTRLIDLYEELVTVSVDDWSRKGLQTKYGAEIIDNAVDVLGFLALELLRSATVQDREWLLQSVTRYFIQYLKVDTERASRLAARFLEFAGAECLFLRKAGDRLYWTHLSFQDYFAALRLTTSADEVGNAVKAIRSRWFDANRGNAPAFATAMLTNDAERVELVREVLASGRPERRDFLRKIIIEGAVLPSDVVRSLVDDLVGTARDERAEYGAQLRPSARSSFAFDLLMSLRRLPAAAEALETIARDQDWPSQMREKARASYAGVT